MHMRTALLLAVVVPTLFGSENVLADVKNYRLISITQLTADGGRVDWSPDGRWLAFDRAGEDGLFDIYIMRPDGGDLECLTCPDPILHPELPVDRQIGQPAFHPGGVWLAMQVEKASHKNDNSHSSPGAGSYHDLWVMNLNDRSCFKLTDVSDGLGVDSPMGGTLHPVFSHDGTRILWTDMQDYGAGLGLFGDWQLALADFVTEPEPRLAERVDFNPGESGLWYESHGFGPDDSWIYFSGNTMGTWELYADINMMRLDEAPGFTRLTRSAGYRVDEPGSYDEHAHFSRSFDAFVWLNNESGESEIWMANADGSERVQLTHFNTEGHPEYEMVRGLNSVPSDNAFNPVPPPGLEQLAVYVQVDFNPLENGATFNELYLLQFEVGPTQDEDGGTPDGGVADADGGDTASDYDPADDKPSDGCSCATGPGRSVWLWLVGLLCFFPRCRRQDRRSAW